MCFSDFRLEINLCFIFDVLASSQHDYNQCANEVPGAGSSNWTERFSTM